MTIQEKYLYKIIECLSPYQRHSFRDGDGFKLACPFCRYAQKNESKSREKCASIYPVEGSFSYFFSCNRGLNGGVGNHDCSTTIRFSTFLKKWHPPLFRQYVRQKEMAKKNYQPKFPG